MSPVHLRGSSKEMVVEYPTNVARFAFVDFKSEEDQKLAVGLSERLLEGRKLLIKLGTSSSERLIWYLSRTNVLTRQVMITLPSRMLEHQNHQKV